MSVQAHDHSHHHHHAADVGLARRDAMAPVRSVVPAFSLLRMSGLQRLGLAAVLVLAIWAGVFWVLQ
jgi:hypothetical protein